MKQYNRDFETRIKRLSVLSQQKETIKLVRVKQIEVKQMNSSYANLWNFTMNLYKPDKMLKYNYIGGI